MPLYLGCPSSLGEFHPERQLQHVCPIAPERPLILQQQFDGGSQSRGLESVVPREVQVGMLAGVLQLEWPWAAQELQPTHALRLSGQENRVS